MIVSVSEFNSFLKRILSEELLSIQEIITPARSIFNSSNSFFKPFGKEDSPPDDLGSCRTVDPVKLLFYPPSERVFPDNNNNKIRLIAGLKACDINALKILDSALMNNSFSDPSYRHWRSRTFIISSDCTSFLPNCFCTFVGNKPFSESGFDINISAIENYYVITTGSSKGEELFEQMKKSVAIYNPPHNFTDRVKGQREELIKNINTHLQARLRLSEDKYQQKTEDELWKAASKDCIGCGGCTNICPTCYCLILNDESKGKEFIKVRTYDSCQLHGYARVAGGGTPRPKYYQRFRNRLMCKFSYMKSNFGLPGCTGCGRCLDVCNLGADFVMLSKKVLNKTSAESFPEPVKRSLEISHEDIL